MSREMKMGSHREVLRLATLLWGICVMAAVGGGAGAQSESSATWAIDKEASLVAVVTHKKGLASGLAHEHLIAAPLEGLEIDFDPDKPEATRVDMELRANDLLVDDPALQQAWQPDLLSAGVLTAPFSELNPKDRRKIRESMLGRKQLDAGSFPTIRAKVGEVVIEGPEAVVQVALRVRDRSVRRTVRIPLPAVSGDELRAAFVARFQFTEFGIRPYSALLGAIRVADEFDVVVRLVATATRNAPGE